MSVSFYDISGPTQIGSSIYQNEFFGSIELSNITVSDGSMLYTDSNNFLQSLNPPISNSILVFNNSGNSQNVNKRPTWLSIDGLVGTSLKVTSANLLGWDYNTTQPFGFFAHKANSQIIVASPTTVSNITNWNVSNTANGEYNAINDIFTFNPNVGSITIDFSGYYYIACGVQMSSDVLGTRILRISQNYTNTLLEAQWPPISAQFQVQNLSGTFNLNAKDIITVQLLQTDGSTANITVHNSTGTYWGLHRLYLL